jgi:O-antigen/teichoic acid export membrane protein
MASYTKKIAANTLIQIVGKFITTAISVVMLAYMARYLGVTGYGEYTTIFAFLGFFAIVADMGFFTVAVREMAKAPENSYKIMSNIFSIRMIFAITILLIAPIIATLIPSYGMEIKNGIWIGSLSSLFVLTNQIIISIFQVNLRMDRLVISDIGSRMILFITVLASIYFKLPLQYFVLANVLANLTGCILSFAMSRRFVKFGFRFDMKYWKYILRESVVLGVFIMLGLIYFKIDNIMLSLIKGSEAVGIYGAPYKILEILITIPAIFMGSVFPLIAKYIHEKDPRAKTSFLKSFDFMSIMAFPITIGILALARPIVFLVLGSEFSSSVIVLQYLVFAVMIIFFGTIAGNFIIAANYQNRLIAISIFNVIINIIGNLILIPRYSYMGAAVMTICTEALSCLLSFGLVYICLKFIPSFKTFFKALFSALIMGAYLYYFSDENLLLLIVTGGAVYLATLFVLKGISKQTIRDVIKS